MLAQTLYLVARTLLAVCTSTLDLVDRRTATLE
jgi:hypothetical protein